MSKRKLPLDAIAARLKAPAAESNQRDLFAPLGIDASPRGIEIAMNFSSSTIDMLSQMLTDMELPARVNKDSIAVLNESRTSVAKTISVDEFTSEIAAGIRAHLKSKEERNLITQPMLYTLEWATPEEALEKQIILKGPDGVEEAKRALRELKEMSSAGTLKAYKTKWHKLHEPPEPKPGQEGRFRRDILIEYLDDCARMGKIPVIKESRAALHDGDTTFLKGRDLSKIKFPKGTDFSDMDLRGTSLRFPPGTDITNTKFGRDETGKKTQFVERSDISQIKGWQLHDIFPSDESFSPENIDGLKRSVYNRLVDPDGQAAKESEGRKRRAAKRALRKTEELAALQAPVEPQITIVPQEPEAQRQSTRREENLLGGSTQQGRRNAGSYTATQSLSSHAARTTSQFVPRGGLGKSKEQLHSAFEEIMSMPDSHSTVAETIDAILTKPTNLVDDLLQDPKSGASFSDRAKTESPSVRGNKRR